MREVFAHRHISIGQEEEKKILSTLGFPTLDSFTQQVIPRAIQLEKYDFSLTAMDEFTFSHHIKALENKNERYTSYIGQGYYPSIMPSVIKRNVFENPGWYTAYTPYQSEIAQGRLEALFYFQTLIVELTQLPIANASLLDEATACVEGMLMLYKNRKNKECRKIFVDQHIFKQTLSVLQNRARLLEITVEVGDSKKIDSSEHYACIILQYPNAQGEIPDYARIIAQGKARQTGVLMVCDLMALCLLQSPGFLGADVAVGSTQRFGLPMGFGGPHAAYIACKEIYKRFIPGRIIGKTTDRYGAQAYRMALQTREQHIRREKATSNICTAQVFPAVLAAFYAIWHGPEGLKKIASKIHSLTFLLAQELRSLGIAIKNKYFFDTLCLEGLEEKTIKNICQKQKINLGFGKQKILISISEKDTLESVGQLIAVFQTYKNRKKAQTLSLPKQSNIKHLLRNKPFLQQKAFLKYHSEHAFLRFVKHLENKDYSLCHGMIPLGSCTMKLNGSTEMETISLSGFTDIHPFAPPSQTRAYEQINTELSHYLSSLTGLDACSLQPNSGAQGELAGLMAIKDFLRDKKEIQRDIIVIPTSAHGTNPASAMCCGFKVEKLNCLPSGDIDMEALDVLLAEKSNQIAALMVTYPSTFGIFEPSIKVVIDKIHEAGAQVYLDGANLNAQLGLTSPAILGVDVCHINLHKTFCIPHGGGGPGMGPICVAKHLAPYLPNNPCADTKVSNAVSASDYGSGLILLISYAFIRLMGSEGLKKSSQVAILNANYIKHQLEKNFSIGFQDHQGWVAHEVIIDLNAYKKIGISVIDIAKRLMDYSLHAPTVSFPKPDIFMIEPTESESLEEMNRFCIAMNKIYEELKEIENTPSLKNNNLIVNAPHPVHCFVAQDWNFPYTKQSAAFPSEDLKDKKFWVTIGRINDAQGDRNLMCCCQNF